jgi:hypothetical protein
VAYWLKGSHVYALYESYDLTKHQIEITFITGFFSSMLFGTVVASFADKTYFLNIFYGPDELLILYTQNSKEEEN